MTIHILGSKNIVFAFAVSACALAGQCVQAQPVTPSCATLLQEFNEHVQVRFNAERKLVDHPKQNNEEEWAAYPGYWQKVIDSGREYLTRCPNQSFVLEEIAEGLDYQNHPEDAAPLLKRCVSIDPEDSSCWVRLGDIMERLCRPNEAKESYQRVIDIGGFNKSNALAVESAKRELEMRENPEWLRLRGVTCPINSSDDHEFSDAASVRKQFGSGFFVNKQGYILTNDHVVAGCRLLSIRNGKPLIVVDRDQRIDLAILKIDARTDNVAIFRSGALPKSGDTVITFGFPLPDILSSEGNVSSGSLSATSGILNDVRFLQISAPVQPGNSGGPLLDSSGHVIGVVVAKLDALRIANLTGDVPQNVNFAVSWAEIRAFLDEEHIEYTRAASTKTLETSVITEEAKQYTVAIECDK